MYCTLDDLKDQIPAEDLGQLCFDGRERDYPTEADLQAAINEAIADRCGKGIEDADAEIDSYCGGRYDVPFSPVPRIIRKASVDIALYNLCARRGAVTDDRKDRYNATVKLLRDVAKGLVSLGAQAPDEIPGTGISVVTPPRIFTQDAWRRF